MAAAADVDLVGDLDGEFDIADFDDVIQAFDDVDVSSDDEFVLRGGTCHCHYSAIFSDADIVSYCRHGCGDDVGGDSGAAAACACLLAGLGDEADEEEAGSSSPADSGLTDDAPLATVAGVDEADAEAMSAYVAELERFLLDDDDDAPCGEQADGLLGVVDDYFAGDQLLATAADVVPAAGGAERTDDGKEEENGDVLAAREDEQSASRKRARNKIKGTAMLTPWGELDELMNLTTMHLAQIQVPPDAGCGSLLLCCAACRMWPSGLIA